MSSAVSSDKDSGPVYFWREFEEPYGFLSQWYDCAFEHQGTTYRTAEEWMMVQKAKLFGDEVSLSVGCTLRCHTARRPDICGHLVQLSFSRSISVFVTCETYFLTLNTSMIQEIAKQMLQVTTPAEHKALGRKVKGFDKAKWDESVCALGI